MESSMKVLRFSKLQERVGLSRTHVGRLEKAGEFPRRVALGPRSVGWIESEVNFWLESRERVGSGKRIGGVDENKVIREAVASVPPSVGPTLGADALPRLCTALDQSKAEARAAVGGLRVAGTSSHGKTSRP